MLSFSTFLLFAVFSIYAESIFWNFGCGAAQLVVRRLAVRQARVRISSRHPMEAPLAERRRDEDSRRRASANGEG